MFDAIERDQEPYLIKVASWDINHVFDIVNRLFNFDLVWVETIQINSQIFSRYQIISQVRFAVLHQHLDGSLITLLCRFVSTSPAALYQISGLPLGLRSKDLLPILYYSGGRDF